MYEKIQSSYALNIKVEKKNRNDFNGEKKETVLINGSKFLMRRSRISLCASDYPHSYEREKSTLILIR